MIYNVLSVMLIPTICNYLHLYSFFELMLLQLSRELSDIAAELILQRSHLDSATRSTSQDRLVTGTRSCRPPANCHASTCPRD